MSYINAHTMRKALTALIAGGCMILAVNPAHAQKKGFLEDWFPFLFEEEDTGPKPEDTLQAPFMEKGTAASGSSSLPGVAYQPQAAIESGVAIDQAHRQPAQVEQWVAGVLVDSLDFDPLRYEAHLKTLSRSMTPYSQEAFKAFMTKDNLLAALQSNDLLMRVFTSEPGRTLNQGALQGRYRWLVETPVTITFLPRGLQDYKNVKPKSQALNIRTQIGRVEQGGDDGMIIETLEIIPVVPKQ
ncbi:MAG: DotI/IcmL family type IV secretion protein [Micavibrio aeruginosavorus]|uniref:DotI/IcmL family type IV secretion protein n=1 Tax=Micavibrio aeruginosavorus TaxID=349221 RepID=A0A7T5R396_9BACT|nr:MAG: DotI/IcmL family type IV secretion protein [Micavibrio aeruginosavorus]